MLLLFLTRVPNPLKCVQWTVESKKSHLQGGTNRQEQHHITDTLQESMESFRQGGNCFARHTDV